MTILGIETSCDETAAAIVVDGCRLVANVVESQIDIHKVYGGVVPEIASRSHLEAIIPVVDASLHEAFCEPDCSRISHLNLITDNIDAIAVTQGPGLSGSLLIGTLTARSLALVYNKPIYGVHHILGHIYANFLDMPAADIFPMLALVVSGGHSQLMLFQDHLDYKLLGQTQDDAVGEAFDKVAKMLGLEYPGGPSVAKAAEQGDPKKYQFPIAQMSGRYDFSFSGLKTAVLRTLQAEINESYDFPSFKLSGRLNHAQINDVAASFQSAAVETLVRKTKKAVEEFKPKTIVIGGGVAANQCLRSRLTERLDIEPHFIAPKLCTDNAAMIAALGYYVSEARLPDDPNNLTIRPSWGL